MNERPIEPGDVYLVNGLVCIVTYIGKKACVMFDDGSVDQLPPHQLYEGVLIGMLPDYYKAFLSALKTVGERNEPEPLYTDETVQRAHRTGMLLGAISTCDDIYSRLLQAAKNPDATFQGAVRIVEAYIAGVQHLGIKDGIAAEPSENNVIPLNKGGVQ